MSIRKSFSWSLKPTRDESADPGSSIPGRPSDLISCHASILGVSPQFPIFRHAPARPLLAAGSGTRKSRTVTHVLNLKCYLCLDRALGHSLVFGIWLLVIIHPFLQNRAKTPVIPPHSSNRKKFFSHRGSPFCSLHEAPDLNEK